MTGPSIVTSAARIARRGWSFYRDTAFPVSARRPADDASAGASSRPDRLLTVGPWVVGVAAAVLFGLNLGFPLAEPDESRYAHVARQMLERGDWLVPRRGGEPFLDKPPLAYWAMAVSMAVFGTNEAAARLPMAVAGWCGVMLVWSLGRRIVGPRGALFGAVALLLCAGYVLTGRYILTDMVLSFFVVLATWAAYLAVGSATFGRRWWYLAAVATGLAVLAKGPIGLVLPALPVVATGLLGAWRSRPTWHDWVGAWAITIALSTWWFVALAIYEPQFGPHFFYRQHVVRFTDAFDHREPFWYYGPAVLIGMLPASVLLPGMLWALGSRKAYGAALRDRGTGYLALSAAAIVGLFSCSECKLPTYILPAVPSLALLIGAFLDRVLLPRTAAAAAPLPAYLRHLRRDVPYLALGVGGLVGLALVVTMAVVTDGSYVAVCGTSVAVVAGLAVGAAVFVRTALAPGRPDAVRWAGAAVATVSLVIVTFLGVYPAAIGYRSYMLHARQVADALDAEDASPGVSGDDTRIVFVGALPHGSEFVLPTARTHHVAVADATPLAELAERYGEIVVVSPPKCLPTLVPAVGDRVTWEHLGQRGFIHVLRPAGPSPGDPTRTDVAGRGPAGPTR